ncbi:MAG: hypothetical protein J2P17_17030 [Mycobacterium sp.]|nr:hypothetical protein [Mycobacterium sp.]
MRFANWRDNTVTTAPKQPAIGKPSYPGVPVTRHPTLNSADRHVFQQALVCQVLLRSGRPKQTRIIALAGPRPNIACWMAANDPRRIDPIELHRDGDACRRTFYTPHR